MQELRDVRQAIFRKKLRREDIATDMYLENGTANDCGASLQTQQFCFMPGEPHRGGNQGDLKN